jgi:hypothetical protein
MGVMSHNGKWTQRKSKSVQVIVCTSHVFIPKYYRCTVCLTSVFLTRCRMHLWCWCQPAHIVTEFRNHRRSQQLWSPLSTSFARDTQWHNLGWKCTVVLHDGKRLQKFWFVGYHLRLQFVGHHLRLFCHQNAKLLHDLHTQLRYVVLYGHESVWITRQSQLIYYKSYIK